ncbi:hypothetical protein [Bradyrhizobium sp. McL0616]|uniref:hypothetical protein n=1 Tax=Bradyrhizobium sp. McL0616 TaxID=3415674 RepID=UPI003CF6636B
MGKYFTTSGRRILTTKGLKMKTGRELRATADALLTTVARHVKAAAKKKPAAAAKPANRASDSVLQRLV